MFPKGYMIIYIKPNDEPQLAWFNPLGDIVFDDLLVLLQEELGDNYDFN